MDRRKAMKVTAGVLAGGTLGLLTISGAFKPQNKFDVESHKLDYNPPETNWKYTLLDPAETSELAYKYYNEGSCMYATVMSVVSQLAVKFGEPYTSFPFHMFKYGHGGVGGYGSLCGALNGAAAIIGLLISDKNIQNSMIADIFQWYEKEPLPEFIPLIPVIDFIPPTCISNSILCHASNTNWSNGSGFKIDSDERKERCRRLTSDVAKKLTIALNEIFNNNYITSINSDETVASCVVCHGDEGKLNNTASMMSCNSCHSESAGHALFSDVHYKMMKEE